MLNRRHIMRKKSILVYIECEGRRKNISRGRRLTFLKSRTGKCSDSKQIFYKMHHWFVI